MFVTREGGRFDAVERDSAQGSTRDLTHFRLGPPRGAGDDYPKGLCLKPAPNDNPCQTITTIIKVPVSTDLPPRMIATRNFPAPRTLLTYFNIFGQDLDLL